MAISLVDVSTTYTTSRLARPVSFRWVGLHGRRDLRRVLLGVLAHPPGEELDRHDTDRRMAALAGPVGIGKRLEQPRELLVLGHDRVEQVRDRLATGQAGAAIALLVEIAEDRRVFVEEASNPEPVDVDDDVAQVGQCLQRGPLAFPRRPAEPVRRRILHDAPYDAGRGAHPLEDRAMLRAHSKRFPFREKLSPRRGGDEGRRGSVSVRTLTARSPGG